MQHQLHPEPTKENETDVLIRATDIADSPMTFCYL
jgi:hypothetical protein